MSNSTSASPAKEVGRPDGRLVGVKSSRPVLVGDLVSSVIAEMQSKEPTPERVPADTYRHLEDIFYELWTASPALAPCPVAADWTRQVRNWEDAGLTGAEIAGFIDYIADRPDIAPADRWRYFCGCCWSTVRTARTRRAGEVS